MTFDEALREKKEAEIEFAESKQAVRLIVVPELISDQEKFMDFYTEDNYKDDLCLLFSSNDQYTVLISFIR
ncbi:hypothetical protein [Chryseobacterium lathyri]|uniref:Uncharacterized protein n=1 Tax=Chryseobacterium lathyri TaxID=395933 RepID=A0A511Y8S3_9FLAO|nr:hypothetical protein [Chryseobacterium lathyri]GEN71592.1 hypothetical protein CLA01_16640 [Chryseobacterium lathyri]